MLMLLLMQHPSPSPLWRGDCSSGRADRYELGGATSSSSVTAENIGFAISANHAMEIAAQLRAAA